MCLKTTDLHLICCHYSAQTALVTLAEYRRYRLRLDVGEIMTCELARATFFAYDNRKVQHDR